jgi:cell division protein FtsB
MPVVPEPKSSSQKLSRSVQPLRRKRVQPQPPAWPNGRRILNVVLVFATVVMLVDALVGEKGLIERMRAGRQYEQQTASLGVLKTENARLRESARRLREDPSAIEAAAREELGLIRPGELLFILRDVTPAVRDPKPVAN